MPSPRTPAPPVAITRTTLRPAVTELVDRFVRVAAAVADPARPVPATPGWSVQDVAAHLVTTIDRYAEGPSGRMARVSDPADLPDLNERLLRGSDWPPLAGLLTELRERTARLLDQVDGYGDDQPSYAFNGDCPVRADQSLGILIGELSVHGGDVARVAGSAWPISARDADMVLYGLEPVLPGWLDVERSRGHDAGYDIRVRGGERHTWVFRDGHLDCHPDAGGSIDCHLSADPGALLQVMYRRHSPWRAAVTGQVTAWGRRPWLALRLADRFHPP